MVKYNYIKAGHIWDRLIKITYDMPDYLNYTQRQIERRFFLRALTRNDYKLKDTYIDYITSYISYCQENKNELQKIALEIVFFTN